MQKIWRNIKKKSRNSNKFNSIYVIHELCGIRAINILNSYVTFMA